SDLKGGIPILLRAIGYDIVFMLNLSAWLILPYILVYLLNRRLATILYITVSVILTLVYLGLVGYFVKALLPLGSDIFGYSITEIQHILNTSGGVTVMSVLPLVIFVALLIFMMIRSTYIRTRRPLVYTFTLVILISVFFSDLASPKAKDFKNDFAYYVAVNKLQFFTSKSYDYVFNDEGDADGLYDEYWYTEAGVPGMNGTSDDFTYSCTNQNFPFLHKEAARDVLGNFFTNNGVKPNIVLIIVESLGRGYSCEGALQGNFTPFLDSLSKHSLYWDNFISTAGRTFGVLPALTGSLPFGDKGFLDLGPNAPNHQSLIKLLKANGYSTSFYYGGNSNFDIMDVYLKKNGIDKITDEKSYGPGYSKLPSSESGFSWGYGDKELYRKSFEIINKENSNKPRLDIYLTVANHSPFLVANQDYYMQAFKRRMVEIHMNDEEKDNAQKYAKQYSCIMYTDDAIRQFIAAYKKRPDFKNTIFIITGDHRMPEIPIITQIDRFHVPFIIYSPMLKRTQRISSVSSHFDLTPSLLAFLNKNYGVQIPSQSAWIGSGLDTFRNFRSVHSYPLMPNKNELIDYIDKDYFIADKQVYKVSENLNLDPIDDEAVKSRILAKFADYKSKNQVATKSNRLIPDDVYNFKPTFMVNSK
ncbi:MAG: LTA synthase family protein, partial [Bacteroidetes bacterium]|nr:LTA synthase family protein [Bacteroidota bacterium]